MRMISTKRIIIKLTVVLLVLVTGSLTFTTKTHAASSLYFSPGSGNFYVGNNFTIGIYISTDQAVNAVDTSISYSSDLLSIVSCSSGGPGFDTPIPTSTTGCTNLVAGTTGSYQGGGGKVGSITFNAKKAGRATVTVSGSAALNGSAISVSGKSTYYNLSVYVPPIQVPGTVNVTSVSHPNQNEWYKDQKLSVSWNKESNVNGFSYILDQIENTIPQDSVISQGTGADLLLSSEGIWYFHIKAVSEAGWGTTTHFKINYDTTGPSFKVSKMEDKQDLRPIITFSAEDSASQLDHYEISIDNKDFVTVISPYKTDTLSKGKHTIKLKAFDKAQNITIKELSINIGSVQPPTITELTYESLYIGKVTSRINIRGTAPASSTVEITINPGNIQLKAKTEDDGNWESVYSDKLKAGEYKITVSTEISGMKSQEAKQYSFVLNNTSESGFLSLPMTGGKYISPIFLYISMFIIGMIIGGSGIFFIIEHKEHTKIEVVDGISNAVVPFKKKMDLPPLKSSKVIKDVVTDSSTDELFSNNKENDNDTVELS